MKAKCHARHRSAALLLALALQAACASAQDAGMDRESGAPDERRDLPLLPMMAEHQKHNMRGNLVAVRDMVAGLAAEDFDAVEAAAARIGYSDSMGRMCENLGAAAPGFAQQAIAFHRSADDIAAAAHAHDLAATMRALSITLSACTTCHAGWKQREVDALTWERLKSQSIPPAKSGG